MAAKTKATGFSREAFFTVHQAVQRFSLALHDALLECPAAEGTVETAQVAEAAGRVHRLLGAEAQAERHGQDRNAA